MPYKKTSTVLRISIQTMSNLHAIVIYQKKRKNNV
jgi:hypothetical protein